MKRKTLPLLKIIMKNICVSNKVEEHCESSTKTFMMPNMNSMIMNNNLQLGLLV